MINENIKPIHDIWIRCIIIDKDNKIKKMYDQHISEINLSNDIKAQILKLSKDSMCFLVIQADDDKILHANILLGVVPTSFNSGDHNKSITNNEITFKFDATNNEV